MYGSYEVNVLFRIRYLLQEARYTVDGASRRLWQETEQVDPELRAQLAEIRDDLLAALVASRSVRRAIKERAGNGSVDVPGTANAAGARTVTEKTIF